MTRTGIVALALAVVTAACTSAEGAVDDVGTVTTTTFSAVTTLPPPMTTTTVAPATTTSTPPVTTTTVAVPPNDCEVGPRTSVEGYGQGCDVLGIEILAAESVDPASLIAAADRVYNLLLYRPNYLAAIVTAGLSGRVLGAEQRITALPEFGDVYELYPGTDWRRKGRSFPGTTDLPYFVGAEENLVCSDTDRYEGEDMLVRELALTVRRFAMDEVDPQTSRAIEQAYGVAIAQGLWENTLAEIDSDQYWMEGVQSFFDANLEDTAEDREPNSEHNFVNTRDELRVYDPRLYTIAASVFGESDWRPGCA